MATDVMLRDKWFAAPDTFSRSAEATQVLRATDLIIGDDYDSQLVEVDGHHYSGLSLRGARLVPPPRPEDYIDDEADEEVQRAAESIDLSWLMRIHRRIELWLLHRQVATD